MRNFRDLFLIFVLFIISLVDSWGACINSPETFSLGTFHVCNSTDCGGPDACQYKATCQDALSYISINCPSTYASGGYYYTNPSPGITSYNYPGAGNLFTCPQTRTTCYGDSPGGYFVLSCKYNTRCSSQIESDSLACLHNGNLWIDGECCDNQCVCEKDGGRWENGQCNPACNDHVPVPDKCEEVFRNGYGMEGGYWAIQTYECFFDSCAMSLNCTEKSQFPAGNLTCDDFQDTTETPGRCVGAIGHTCTIECPGNRTKTCDCDGSCSHAMTLPQCQCQSSSSQPPQSSSSGQNQSSDSQSSDSQSSSSQTPSPGSSSGGPGGGDDWEYDYREILNRIEDNTVASVGYLSSIDKRITAQNMLIQESTNRIVSSNEAAAASAAAAIGETKDTLHNTNVILSGIDSRLSNLGETKDTLHRTNEILDGIGASLGTLDSNVDVPDISAWQTSADSIINKLQHPDTALLKVDSLSNDTSAFKTKYSSFFVHDVYTRNGCYEFVIKKPAQNSRFGRFFSSDISVNFGSIGGFDFCAILRGLCRIAGAVLVLLISIKSYRSAFSSEDG